MKRHKGTKGTPGARQSFELLETRDHLEQVRRYPACLYGDGTTIVPNVSLVMSEAERPGKRGDLFKGHKSAVMAMNSPVRRGRVVASFTDQQLKGRKVNAFCQTK
jgi:hypothetical protein